MKKGILLFLLGLFIVSNSNAYEIIGKWKLTYCRHSSSIHSHLEFKSDGTFSYTSTEKADYEEHGKYKVEGDILYQLFSDENEWYQSKICLLNSISLTLQDFRDDGVTLTDVVYSYQKENPEPSNTANPLIYGKWMVSGNNPFSATHVTYKTDGTFSYTSIEKPDYEENGVFRIEGDILYELFYDEEEWLMSKIITLDSSNLFLMELKDDGITGYRQIAFNKIEDYSEINTIISYQEKKSIYSLKGERLKYPLKGINIIEMSDGTTKKVLVK